MKITNFCFTKLVTTPVCDGYVKLSEDLKVWVNEDEYLIKAGFVTNFRSGGKLSNLFLPKVSNETKAICYVLHDALYTKQILTSIGKARGCLASKEQADDMLLSLLKDDNKHIESEILYWENSYKNKLCSKKEAKLIINNIKKDILCWFDLKLIEYALKWFGGTFYGTRIAFPENDNENKVFKICK